VGELVNDDVGAEAAVAALKMNMSMLPGSPWGVMVNLELFSLVPSWALMIPVWPSFPPFDDVVGLEVTGGSLEAEEVEQVLNHEHGVEELDYGGVDAVGLGVL
jgi:hypothetical protein